jgi:hypothetical protein
MLRLTGFRRARCGATRALMLACVFVTAVNARQQDAASDNSATKSTTKAPVHRTNKAKTASTGTKSGTTHAAKHSLRRRKSARARGQQKIDSERAREIQEALIREHYLSGEATGTWDQASEAAMQRYQGDHGWQTKEVPDSRALIKLGLGPSKDHLLNPESAMTTGPDASRASSLPTASHSATPVADPTAPSSNPNDPPRPQ